MEDADAPDDDALIREESREPSLEDLVALCRALNGRGARYVIVGGFAIMQAGYNRRTMDIDLLVETTLENESRVRAALSSLPDNAAAELKPGDIDAYGVVRVADEFTVDLMKSGCGVTYAEARPSAIIREIDGVPIPFASPAMLWKMKQTVREKDIPDRKFLQQLLAAQGIPLDPPIDAAPDSNPLASVPPWLQRTLVRLDAWLKRGQGG